MLPYLETRQILLITGLRRVGKTTLMHQLIEHVLTHGTDRYHVLYFSFDEIGQEPEAILKEFEFDILKRDLQGEEVFVFFDEIQKLNDWEAKIKLLYDRQPRMKLVLSGSAQITMWRGSRESLAGRFFDVRVEPLDFAEYLQFKEIDIDKDREKVFEKELRRHFSDYLRCGGFVETLDFNEPMLHKYIRESLLERVIFVDIPQSFAINSPELLFRLLEISASRPGLYLDYKNLAADLRMDQRTMAHYAACLEWALLCQKLYNFSPNLLTSEKKIKRLYLSNTAFTRALEPQVDFSLLVEQHFVNRLHALFFWRDPQKREVDLIYTKNSGTLPIEIKIKNKIDKRDIQGLFKFMDKYKLTKGLLITLDTKAAYEKEGRKITALPYWQYWTLDREIGEAMGSE
ncbi:MAG: ATP-binding protein [Desulfobacteraceae bacterium]